PSSFRSLCRLLAGSHARREPVESRAVGDGIQVLRGADGRRPFLNHHPGAQIISTRLSVRYTSQLREAPMKCRRCRKDDSARFSPQSQVRVWGRDGSCSVRAASNQMTKDEGGSAGLVITSRDVTEQRALEDRLRHALRMESIAQLATAAAHEINNPLAVLLGH